MSFHAQQSEAVRMQMALSLSRSRRRNAVCCMLCSLTKSKLGVEQRLSGVLTPDRSEVLISIELQDETRRDERPHVIFNGLAYRYDHLRSRIDIMLVSAASARHFNSVQFSIQCIHSSTVSHSLIVSPIHMIFS